MPDVHALLSASAAERWMNCPGSVLASKNIPDTVSQYAEEGTLAHRLCELKLKKLFGIPEPMSRQKFKSELLRISQDPMYNPEMDSCSDTYVEHIQETLIKFPKRPCIFVEQRVDFSSVVPDGFGTTDCIVVSDTELHVFDYKHGQGVPVSAVENSQLKLYALGAVQMYGPFYANIKNVYLHVIQPRLNNVSVFETTVEDIKRWGDSVVKPAAYRALQPDAPYVPGDKQCRFCKIRHTCRARADAAKAIKNNPMFSKLPPVLTDAEVGEAITIGKDVADWLKKLQEYAAKKLESGGSIPGYKLVEGRTTRVWDDQNSAFADMRANGIDDALLFERTPLSVAKLEKVIDKKLFARIAAPHVTVSPGKPTMVPETDPRKPWSAAKADFSDILKQKGE